MPKLSPEAEAIWNAYSTMADLYNCEVTQAEMLASALRTAAEQFYERWNCHCCAECAEHLRSIANELDTSESLQPS
jgi:hypothetical protein